MAAIASLSSVAEKWTRVTPQRATDYENGVKAPRKDWERATVAAAEAWKAGVAAAAAAGSFAKGVSLAKTAAWQRGAVEKGVTRWGQGVTLSSGKYESAFAPYHRAIEAVQLPARYARRDPRNLDRVKAVVEAMQRVKAAK
jgi:hypothetical protein